MPDVNDFTAMSELITSTSEDQRKVEEMVSVEKEKWTSAADKPHLMRQKHLHYILKCLNGLPKTYASMDASRSWFCYWGLHSLSIMSYKPEKSLLRRIITFLSTCKTQEGGYSGGPGQMAHLATTYASVMALIIAGTEEAISSIDKEGLWKFIRSMRQPNGSFCIHEGGETDVRAAYCALAVAHICGLFRLDELFDGTASWLMRCQTYEGGFAGEPGCEAHGGYTFCALAGLSLLQKLHLVDTDSLLKWLANKQMTFEGGFQGRTNKLVDGCYSYWQAACFSAIECSVNERDKPIFPLFDVEALKNYILIACQAPAGGLRDKPDKNPDLYHTCYTLSGLSICNLHSLDSGANQDTKQCGIEAIHPIYNISMDAYRKAVEYFGIGTAN